MSPHKKILALISILCLAFPLAGGAAGAEENFFTLDRAIELARKNNPVLRVVREQVIQAEADVEKASAALGPKLRAQVGYTRYNEEPRNPVLTSSGLPTGNYTVKGFEDTWQAALTLTQVLYSGGSLRANRSAATLQTDARKAQEIRTLQGVENQVSRAYYGLQRARANLNVAEESVRLAREHLDEVHTLFKHGVIAKNEVLRVQVDVSNAELMRIQAENSVNVAWKGLSRAVGVLLNEKMKLPEPESDAKLPPMPETPAKLALAQRPEMKALDLSRRAALQTARAAAGQARPQLLFEGMAQDIGDDFYPDVQDKWTLSIMARWTLYDHGEVKSQVKKARSLAREFLGQVDDLEKQIVLEVATARLNMESSLQRLAVTHTQVELAEEDYRMALQRYRVQAGTNLDVLDARMALIDARTQMVAAVYDAYTAQANFSYALGETRSEKS